MPVLCECRRRTDPWQARRVGARRSDARSREGSASHYRRHLPSLLRVRVADQIEPGSVGPGPNVFHAGNVNVDADGRLHLRIAYRNGRWTCAEVGLTRPLGYGTYRFDVESTHDLDPRAVLGLFTWDDSAPDHHYREIDIEIGRWGRANNANAQFVVQPFARPGHIHRFELPRGRARHEFAWSAGAVSFETRLIDGPSLPVVVSRYTVDEGVPRAGRESPRINLWLVGGQPPTDGQEVPVIVRAVCVHSSEMILPVRSASRSRSVFLSCQILRRGWPRRNATLASLGRITNPRL